MLTILLLTRIVFFSLCFFVQFFIVLSCLISVSVNFSTFLVIGKTSAVTYQVLGHLKTCLVLAFGYVLLHDPFSWRNILGILVAIVGMVLYSYCCSLESQQKSNEVSSAQLSQVLSVVLQLICYMLLYRPGTRIKISISGFQFYRYIDTMLISRGISVNQKIYKIYLNI